MNDIQKQLFQKAIASWSGIYLALSKNIHLHESDEESHLAFRGRETRLKQWKWMPFLSKELQNYLSPTETALIIQELNSDERKSYHIIIEDDGMFYGVELDMDSNYSFRYHSGSYYNYKLGDVETNQINVRLTYLRPIIEQMFSQLPEYRLYAATGLLTFE